MAMGIFPIITFYTNSKSVRTVVSSHSLMYYHYPVTMRDVRRLHYQMRDSSILLFH